MTTRRSAPPEDLKSALVAAAVELLRTTDAAELSLREVARKAGVASSAPYHHYRSKAELLVDVAIEGLAELGARLARIDARRERPEVRLAARVVAYIRFAIEHGAHYRVMFSPALREADSHERHDALARELFERLVQAVAAVRPDAAPNEAQRLAFSIWAAAHGAVLLALDGSIDALAGPRATGLLVESTGAHLAQMVLRGCGIADEHGAQR